MANPLLASDANGEWFEIFNTSANAIDINGITISDNGSNSHLIDHGSSLFIHPGNYLVLGRNGDSAVNGGYFADYVYNNFTLGNTNDQIILTRDDIQLVRLDYSGTPFGVAGVSAELFIQTINPTASDYQLTQNNSYGLGDLGTPGAEGSLNLTNVNPVPLPGALSLFASALLILGRKGIFFKRTSVQQSLSS